MGFATVTVKQMPFIFKHAHMNLVPEKSSMQKNSVGKAEEYCNAIDTAIKQVRLGTCYYFFRFK